MPTIKNHPDPLIKEAPLTLARARELARAAKASRLSGRGASKAFSDEALRERYLGHFGATVRKSADATAKRVVRKSTVKTTAVKVVGAQKRRTA